METTKKLLFQQLPEPKVPIKSLNGLRVYMLSHVTNYRGLPIDNYKAQGKEGSYYVRVIYPDGTRKWHFFGYTEDVAYNAQSGFYEPSVEGQSSS